MLRPWTSPAPFTDSLRLLSSSPQLRSRNVTNCHNYNEQRATNNLILFCYWMTRYDTTRLKRHSWLQLPSLICTNTVPRQALFIYFSTKVCPSAGGPAFLIGHLYFLQLLHLLSRLHFHHIAAWALSFACLPAFLFASWLYFPRFVFSMFFTSCKLRLISCFHFTTWVVYFKGSARTPDICLFMYHSTSIILHRCYNLTFSCPSIHPHMRFAEYSVFTVSTLSYFIDKLI